MSQLLQGKDSLSDGTAAPDHFWGGFGFDADGSLSVATTGAIAHYHQGLPFTAQGRLCVEVGAVSYFGGGAAPFTSTGRLAFDSAVDIASYLAGIPFSGDGRILLDGIVPLTFATLDPNNKAPVMILSEGNLRCLSNSAAGRGAAFSTVGKSSGKWYWEILSLSAVTAQGVGIGAAGTNINEYLGENAFNWGYFPTGAYWTGGANQGTATPYGVNSILGFALDATGNLAVYVNNVLSFSVAHGLTGPIWAGISDSSTGGVCDFMMNFGQDSSFNGRQTAQNNPDENGNGDFYFAPPAGYLAITN